MRNDRASDTAVLVARSVLLASGHERLRKLVAEGEDALLRAILHEAGPSGLMALAGRFRWVRSALFGLERRFLPGIVAHYLARKRWIESVVRVALGDGVTQVVNVGAGFDTLAPRLHREFHEVCFFELDHPATQGVKRRALGGELGVRFSAVDLGATSLRDALDSLQEFSSADPSIFLAEGLTMYLDPDRVQNLFWQVGELLSSRSGFIFSFMEPDSNGAIAFREESWIVKRWLSWRREPFLWGSSRSGLRELLAECGLAPLRVVDDVILREEILLPLGLEDIPLARGECLCLCSPTT